MLTFVDAAAIRNWRSDTLKALAATEKVKDAHDQILLDIGDWVCRSLAQRYPLLFSEIGTKTRLHKQVMVPVGALANKIHTSTSTYTLSMDETPFIEYDALELEDIGHLAMIDYDTGRPLTTNADVSTNQMGEFGRPILPCEPGLDRSDDGVTVNLRQHSYLVELFQPSAKRQRTFWE